MKGDKLTAKQALFVKHYLIDLNATQAAIRAGYSAKTAHVCGPRMLGNARVAAAIQAARVRVEKKLDITVERILREYARIGFSDLRKYLKWGSPAHKEGEEVTEAGTQFTPSDELDDDAAAAVAEVSEQLTVGGRTLKLKLHDKKGALDSLAKHLGLFKDEASTTINLNLSREARMAQLTTEEKREIAARLRRRKD